MAFLDRLSPVIHWAVVIVLGNIVLAIQVLAPVAFMSSVLYLVPIAYAAWFLGHDVGISIAIVSVLMWGYIDASQSPYSNAGLLVWAVFGRLVFFMLAVQAIHLTQMLNEQARLLAHRDPLTGLVNQRELELMGHLAVARSRRDGTPFTVAFIDVDHFKRVNDGLGHAEGDKVLRLIADTLQTCARETDTIARIGGDEFVALLPTATSEQAKAALDRMAQAVAGRMPAEYPVTLSIGAVTFLQPPADFEEALGRADEMMYEGKTGGRDRILMTVLGAA